MISVIVPVYKVEAYLPACVESLLAQSFTDFELVLVDDGSPDGCPALCDAYAARDARVRVLHKENGGLSDARNAGIEIARGAYVAFVDGDDRVRPDFLRTLMDALDETGAEIAECGVVKVYPGEEAQAEEAAAGAGPAVSQSAESQAGAGPATGLADTEPTAPGTGESPGTGPSPAYTLCSTEHALRLLIGDRVLHQHVWNKLYRRDVLDGIPFPEGRTNEDEFWTYRVFARAAYVCRVDAPLYEYVQREKSIMGSPFTLRRLDGLDARAERLAFVREHFPGLAREAKMNLYGSCIYSGQMSLKYLKGSERHKALKKVDAIRKTCVPTASEIAAEPFSARVWLRLSKVSFFGLCRLKNLLGKGF